MFDSFFFRYLSLADIFLSLSFTRTHNSVEVESNPAGLRCNSRSKINQPVGTHLLGKFSASRKLRSPYLSKTLRRIRRDFSSRIFVRECNKRFPSWNRMTFLEWDYWFSSVFLFYSKHIRLWYICIAEVCIII